jgi:hypothetical protein
VINLPNNGDKVRIWPYPGRRVQIDERAVNHEQGGRFAADEGQLVTWSDYHAEAYRSGDFLLHDPSPRAPEPALEEHPAEPEEQPLPLAAPKGPKRSKDQG